MLFGSGVLFRFTFNGQKFFEMKYALFRQTQVPGTQQWLWHHGGAALPCVFQGRKDADCVTDPAGMGLPMALQRVRLLQYKSFFPIETYYWIQMTF